jgi:hypothetical protein
MTTKTDPSARRKRRRSSNWGGARPGAGRPAKGPIPSEPHTRRPPVAPQHPVHITARLDAALARLPAPRADLALRRALGKAQGRADFRIIYLELRRGRLELIVEAARTIALARGMQGFQIAAARYLNGAAGRHGAAFPDRYRMEVLRTGAEVRAALRVVEPRARLLLPRTRLLQRA